DGLLTSLDVSQNTALQILACPYNQLTDLDISKNTALTHLNCSMNQLTALDVNKNADLNILECYYNQLTNLDISKNTTLYNLDCRNNQLTSIDVSQNTALVELGLDDNQLTSLDVSQNVVLSDMYCLNNQLIDLDVSNNPLLHLLYFSGNQLQSLNLKNGNNTNILMMHAENNPNLACIQVDDPGAAYSNPYWIKDATAIYSTECILSVNETEKLNIEIYPNPAKSVLNIETSLKIEKINVYDTSGKIVKTLQNAGKTIDVSRLQNGVYHLEIFTDRGKVFRKFIVNN
ncbi:MAG: T9SS type A sorting domain-containing protein, partial [Flavobacteriaceae bacterium]|nr:T9SS type A sorting domain-containing protein [Flavobacteriaceae bacterium]